MKKLILALFGIIVIALIVIIINMFNTNKDAASKSLYDAQADKICSMLDKAANMYKNRKYEEAVKISESAYWDVYDNILEIKYRSYTSPANIFQIENSFHAYSQILKAPYKLTEFEKITNAKITLCNEVKKEAKILNKQS